MPPTAEVFISYSHDSPDHVRRVLELSNRLRSDGVDCIIDQYETSPPEGWPRWMDRKIRESRYILMLCTESYFRRVMGEEVPGKGLGVRWEGNLVYQHLYNTGALNTRFIPVVIDATHTSHIPTPVQGATYYDLSAADGYEDLVMHLLDEPKVKKPPLGKRRSLPPLAVKTNPAMFLSTPIDVDLWNEAKWRATFFIHMKGRPPVLGLAFVNEAAARKIFEGWHERYGENDRYEELRVSIVEGPVSGEDDGYTVHIGADPDAAIERFKAAGYAFDIDLFMSVSRLNRMNPPPESRNLAMFKELYAAHKTYFLAPGVISEGSKKLKPLLELGIFKGKVLLRKVSDITEHDLDSMGRSQRSPNTFLTSWCPSLSVNWTPAGHPGMAGALDGIWLF